MTDELGSVANLTSATGATEATYTYSPFGETRTATPDDPLAPANEMRFTGQQLDETGGYNLRARELQPSTGRFLSTDPLEPAATDPSVSAYAYVNDRPTLLVDPTGEKGRAIGAVGGFVGAKPTQTITKVPVGGLGPLVAAGLAADTIVRYFKAFDLDDAFVQTQVEVLFPALSGLNAPITVYDTNPFIKPQRRAYDRPQECMQYIGAFGPALGILSSFRGVPGGIARDATTAAAVYCIDGKLGGVVARSGSSRSTKLPGLAVAPMTGRTEDALGENFQLHAELNALATIVASVPVGSRSVGAIYMAVDNPNTGLICGRCIDAFERFHSYAPGVSLTAMAERNAWQNGTTMTGSGFLGRAGVDF